MIKRPFLPVLNLPDILCFAISSETPLPAELADKKAPEKGVCAYICEDLSCREPVIDFADFKDYLALKRK